MKNWLSKYQVGGPGDDVLQNIYGKWPALKKLGKVTIKPDETFTREKTGFGDIEFFSPNLLQVNYPNGYIAQHPGPGTYGILYNPNTNDEQNIRLDMLHGMSEADPKFRRLRNRFQRSVRHTDINKEMNYWYNKDKEKGNAEDGKKRWMDNYTDGQLRTLLYEGDRSKQNYSDEEANQLLSYPRIKRRFDKLNNYLQRGEYGGDISIPNVYPNQMVPRFQKGGESYSCRPDEYWDTVLKKCVKRPAPFVTSNLDEYDRRIQLASDSTNAAINSRIDIEEANKRNAEGKTITNYNLNPSLSLNDKSFKDKPKIAKRVTTYKKSPSKRYTTDEYKEQLIKEGNNPQATTEFINSSASTISGNQIINPVAITTFPVESKRYDEKGNFIGEGNEEFYPEFQEAKQEVKYVPPPPKFTLTYLDAKGKLQTLNLGDYETWKKVRDRFEGSRAFRGSTENGSRTEANISLGQFGNLNENPEYPGDAAFGSSNITEYINSDSHNLTDTKQINDLFDSPPTKKIQPVINPDGSITNFKFGGLANKYFYNKRYGGFLPSYQKGGEKKKPITHYIFIEGVEGASFNTEAENLKKYIAKNYPEEKVKLISGYGKEYFNKEVLPTLRKVNKEDRVYLFGHHGDAYAGVSTKEWGNAFEKAQKTAGNFNCYLGSCSSEDLFVTRLGKTTREDLNTGIKYGLDPSFSRVSNFYYRPDSPWYGVNPNAPKIGEDSKEGILYAMFSRTLKDSQRKLEEKENEIDSYESDFFKNNETEKSKELQKQISFLKKQAEDKYLQFGIHDSSINNQIEKLNSEIRKENEKIYDKLSKDKKFSGLIKEYEKMVLVKEPAHVTSDLKYGVDYRKNEFNPYINQDFRFDILQNYRPMGLYNQIRREIYNAKTPQPSIFFPYYEKTKYQVGGRVPMYQMPKAVSESTRLGVSSLQRNPEVEREIALQQARAKQGQLSQGRASTPAEERARLAKNRTYASQNAPYVNIDEQGNLSQAFPDASMTGELRPGSAAAKTQKGLEHLMGAMEAVGALQLGAFGARNLVRNFLRKQPSKKIVALENVPEEIGGYEGDVPSITSEQYRRTLKNEELRKEIGNVLKNENFINPSSGGWSPTNNPEVNRIIGLAQYGKRPLISSEDFMTGQEYMNDLIFKKQYLKELNYFEKMGYDTKEAIEKAVDRTYEVLRSNPDFDMELGLRTALKNLQRLNKGKGVDNPFSKDYVPQFLWSEYPFGSQVKKTLRNPLGMIDENWGIGDKTIDVLGDRAVLLNNAKRSIDNTVLRPNMINVRPELSANWGTKAMDLYRRELPEALKNMQLQPYTGSKAFTSITPNKYGGFVKNKNNSWIDKYSKMQDGGDTNKEFVRNWYTNRKITDPYIQEAFELDRPAYMKNVERFPEYEVVESIRNNPNITGNYDVETNKLLVTPNAPSHVKTHELSHYVNLKGGAGDYMRTIHKDIVGNEILPQSSLKGVYKDKYDYFSNPDEVHSRIMVLRQKAGFKPDEFVTPEKLNSFLKTYTGDIDNINDLLQLSKGEEGLLNMLNYMAKNKERKGVSVAKKGGSLDKFYVGKSKIEGKGVFAKKNIKTGEHLGKAHTIVEPYVNYKFTKLGRKHNHSENPNVQNVLIGNERHLVAINPIKKGEEITTNYRLQPDLEQPEDFNMTQSRNTNWLSKYK